MAEQANELQLLEMLDDFAGKLEGGSLDIGEFNTWFMSTEWDARMASNVAALRLGWDIQNILYEWQDFPELIPVSRVAQNIREAMRSYELSSHPLAGARSR